MIYSFLGFSLITNMVVMDIDTDAAEPNHEEVLETSQRRAMDMQKLVKAIVSKITLTPWPSLIYSVLSICVYLYIGVYLLIMLWVHYNVDNSLCWGLQMTKCFIHLQLALLVTYLVIEIYWKGWLRFACLSILWLGKWLMADLLF